MDKPKTRPFHETIVESIIMASNNAVSELLNLINNTTIEEGHTMIIEAIQEKWGNGYFSAHARQVIEKLKQEKSVTEKKESHRNNDRKIPSQGMGRVEYLLDPF